jgi:hypothetical protein
MKQKTLYTTRKLSELHINCCHMGLCELKEHKSCIKKQMCLMQLCENDELRIAKINIFSQRTNYRRNKQALKVEEWRIKQFKKCKPVTFIIKRG